MDRLTHRRAVCALFVWSGGSSGGLGPARVRRSFGYVAPRATDVSGAVSIWCMLLGLLLMSPVVGTQEAVADATSATDFLIGNHQVGFHGYVRGGMGWSQNGKAQAAFGAPGAQSKYRMGNEPDLNAILWFDYRYILRHSTDRPSFLQAAFTLDDYAIWGKIQDEFRMDNVAETYARYVNVGGAGFNVWFGRRFYQRRMLYLNDHFWLNAGQNADSGVGVEDIAVGPGRLHIALFHLKDKTVLSLKGTEELGRTDARALDIRYTNIVLDHHWTLALWANMTHRDGSAELGVPVRYGFGAGGWLERSLPIGGRNIVTVMFRQGAAMVQGTFNPRPVQESQGYDLTNAFSLEANNDLVYECVPLNFALQWGTIARLENFGRKGTAGRSIIWGSTGIHARYFLSNYVNVIGEVGYDYVHDQQHDRSGGVQKSTIGLQLSVGHTFFSRPILYLFATHAAWSRSFKGLVGAGPDTAPYGADTSGWTFGVHVEHWW